MYYPQSGGFNNYPFQYAGSDYNRGYNQNPAQGLKGRPVSSLEEVRAAQIDFDGSLFVFPDIANKKIYTKQINLDGTASLKVFTQVEDTTPAPAYVTKEEFDSTVKSLQDLVLESQRKEIKHETVNTSASSKPAINF